MITGGINGWNPKVAEAKDFSKGAQKGTFTSSLDAQLDENGMVLFGMDKELAAKAALKKDTAVEASCQAWIEALSGAPLAGASLQEGLKDGVALCTAINAIQPGVCPKPSTGKLAFKQMENIANYTEACLKLGVPQFSTFQTVALYENKDMFAVVTNIQALGSAAQRVAGYSGPLLGAKIAEKNEREFSEETLAKGRAEQTFVGKGSTGTAGVEMGPHIDNSRIIDKVAQVKGNMEGIGFDGAVPALGMGSHGTAGSMMDTHIDRSKNIGKMDHVVGADGFGTDGTTTALGMGSHGTEGSKMATHIDHSKNIDKMSHVSGADGFGVGGEMTALGMGSHGQAGTADAFQVDTRLEINKMAMVH